MLRKSFEIDFQMNENIYMKKLSVILAILFLFASNPTNIVLCEEISSDFPAAISTQEDMFAPVELDLTDYTYLNKQNKKFKLSAEKEGKPSFVKNEKMVWDENMLFRYNFYSDDTNLRVLPSYGSIGSFVSTQLDENTSVMIGQDGIDSINGDKVNFAYENYSYYSMGSRLDHQGKNINYSLGAFNETDTMNRQLAAIVATKPRSILNSKGKFYAGTGVFSTLMSDLNFTTTGAFLQYNRDKLSVGTQISNSSYSKSGYVQYSKAHLITKYKVNNHLTLKNKIVQNFDVDEAQGEVGLVLNPLKDTDRLQMEVTAANYQSQNVVTRQRLKFSTSFKF